MSIKPILSLSKDLYKRWSEPMADKGPSTRSKLAQDDNLSFWLPSTL